MTGKISVLMGVYNCQDTLADAIQSIINQTYTNWEIILCDDCSTDNTYDIAYRIASTEPRIVLIKNTKNLGLNQTLNICLKNASGDFIARMDGDDLSLPFRFEKQIAFLQHQTEYDIVSSPMILFDNHGEWGQTKSIAAPNKKDIICGSPICHAPVMMQKSCLDSVNGYTVNKKMIRVEDVNLWIKLYAAGYKCYNIDEPLYKMRNDSNAFSRRKFKYRINSTYVRLQGCKLLHLGVGCYIKAFKPIIIGLIPKRIRYLIKKNI